MKVTLVSLESQHACRPVHDHDGNMLNVEIVPKFSGDQQATLFRILVESDAGKELDSAVVVVSGKTGLLTKKAFKIVPAEVDQPAPAAPEKPPVAADPPAPTPGEP